MNVGNLKRILNLVKNPNVVSCIIADVPGLCNNEKLVPQSFQVRKSATIDIPLAFTYNSDYATRKDELTSFDQIEFREKSGNGSILAYHIMSELLYIIGRTGKYGA